MKPIKSTLAIFLIFCWNNAYSQKSKYDRAIQSYGYHIGQEISLSNIKNNFPHLELKVKYAELKFNTAFGTSRKNIIRYFIEESSETEFLEYDSTLKKEISKLLANQFPDEITALNFLSEVENRAKGEIASPFLESLLTFQFIDSPHEEFLNGFNQVFKTQGHSKAEGTDWQIKIPKSWKASEADRPHIIQKFTSDCGDGLQSILLMARELPPTEKYTPEEINNFFTEKEIKSMVPKGARFINFEKITIEGQNGGVLEIEMTKTRLYTIVYMRIKQYMFFYGNHMYFIQCCVASEDISQDLSSDMKKYKTLFDLVVNSVVINSRYK